MSWQSCRHAPHAPPLLSSCLQKSVPVATARNCVSVRALLSTPAGTLKRCVRPPRPPRIAFGSIRKLSMAAPVGLVEQAKREAAYTAVKDYFDPSFTHVGIGSGSTVVYVVDAIKESIAKAGGTKCVFVPTGSQSKALIVKAGMMPIEYDSIPEEVSLDVAFDGADECDDEFNLVKGGGACLFQEKLVAVKAKKFVCVADYRKDSSRLLTTWPYIPIEVAPMAANVVIAALKALGSPNPSVRTVSATDEQALPLKTDQDFFIVKAPFPQLLLASDAKPASGTGKTPDGLEGKVWEVGSLAATIKAIPGVLDVGIFHGINGIQAQAAGKQGGQKPIAVYFGMQDGTVKVKKAPV